MFKINLLFAFILCCTIVVIQCAPTADTSSAVQGFAFEMIMTKLQLLEDRSTEKEEQMIKRSCADVPSSGIYNIQPEKPFKEPMSVLCDQEYDSGGWIVIQRRFDESTNFFRNWKEYKNGFGNMDAEFWLGLDRIYQLTVSRPHEVVFLLEDFKGNKTFAKYDLFEIGDENKKYVITELGSYSGTAGDSVHVHKGVKFSTFDADNDLVDKNCAMTETGAWWYRECYRSNLNGKYLHGVGGYRFGLLFVFRAHNYPKSTKIMIRTKNH